MNKRILISILLYFIHLSSSQAQIGTYLKNGQNGFGISSSYLRTKDLSGIDGSLAYSIKSTVEFGIDVSKLWSNNESDFNATAITPNFSICLMKQSASIPLSLFLMGGYEFDQYHSKSFESYGLKMIGSGFIMSVTVNHLYQASLLFNLNPIIGFNFTHVSIIQQPGSKNEDDVTSFLGALDFSYKLPNDRILILDPSISFSKRNTNFGISIGLIIPQHWLT